MNDVIRFQPLPQKLDDELREGGEDVDADLKEKQRALIDALPLDQYEVANGDEQRWEEVERQIQKGGVNGTNARTVSVKSGKKMKRKAEDDRTVDGNEGMNDEDTKRTKKHKDVRKSKGRIG